MVTLNRMLIIAKMLSDSRRELALVKKEGSEYLDCLGLEQDYHETYVRNLKWRIQLLENIF